MKPIIHYESMMSSLFGRIERKGHAGVPEGSFVVGKMVTAKTCVPHTTPNINVTNFTLNFASTQILSPDALKV